MACFSSMSGLLPAVVLVLVVLTGTESSGSQGAAAAAATATAAAATAGESDITPGISGSWSDGVGSGWSVWTSRGSNVVLECALATTIPAHDWLNVTWLRNNVSVLDRRHLLTQAGHLNITKIVHRRSGTSDEGEYRCLVTTRMGVITGPPIKLRLASKYTAHTTHCTDVSEVV
nr:neogenin-like [Cherax quadricarinatus]